MTYILYLSLIIFIFFTQGEVTRHTITSPQQESTSDLTNCTLLSPGQSHIFNQSEEESPTGIQRRYRLTRDFVVENQYQIDFHLRFHASDDATFEIGPDIPPPSDLDEKGVDTPVRSDELNASMINRVNQCLREQRGRLRSTNGTTIILNLASAPESEPLQQVDIRITRAGSRSFANAWSRDIDCPTIVHELLHLAGLCDGYHEPTQIQLPSNSSTGPIESTHRYDCRSIETQTIMQNQWQAMQYEHYDLIICSQQPGLRLRRSATLPQNCPDGSPPLESHTRIKRSNLHTWINLNVANLSVVYAPHQLQDRAPLSPAQVRFITRPGCESQSARYIECSQNAYRTSINEGCLPVPDYCRDGGFLQ